MDLPIFELKISEDINSDAEIFAVAGVDKPAIEDAFLKFNTDTMVSLDFAEINKPERILLGAAMIPNMPIFRSAESMKGISQTDCNVFYTAETIKQAAIKFFAKGFQMNYNTMHGDTIDTNSVVFFQSFIKDTAKGVEGLKGDYPDGTWFLGAKVFSDEVWANVESGKIKGWSVEGKFKMSPAQEIPQDFSDEQAIEEIKKLLS